MKNFVFISLMIILASCSSSSVYKPNSEYWNETSFDFKRVTEVINNQKCHKDEKYFFSCVEALNTLLGTKSDNWFAFVDFNRTSQNKPAFLKDIRLPNNVDWIQRGKRSRKALLAKFSNDPYKLNEMYRKNWISFYKKGNKLNFNKIIENSIVDLRRLGVLTTKLEKYHASIMYNSYLETLIGPYTYLQTRQRSEDQYNGSVIQLVGIGAILKKQDDALKVVRVIKKGPAFSSGIKANDLILSVKSNQKSQFISVKNMTVEQGVDLILGNENTVVSLVVKRDKKKRTFNLTRKKFALEESISKKVESFNSKNYLVLDVNRFYSYKFCPKVKGIINEASQYDGLILDLRNNGGGDTDSSNCLAGAFLENGIILNQRRRFYKDLRTPNDIEKDDFIKSEDNVDTRTPLVVLVNKHSASASEFVTSSLQDHNRAIVLGEKTFGKGFGQRGAIRHEEVPYMSDVEDLYIFLTKSSGIRPSKTFIQGDGITPDYYLESKYQKANLLNQWQRDIQDFPWRYVYSYNDYEKYTHPQNKIKRNNKFSKCMNSKKGLISKEFNIRKKKSDDLASDYNLTQALASFECL